jgi:hypothetical protein
MICELAPPVRKPAIQALVNHTAMQRLGLLQCEEIAAM